MHNYEDLVRKTKPKQQEKREDKKMKYSVRPPQMAWSGYIYITIQALLCLTKTNKKKKENEDIY